MTLPAFGVPIADGDRAQFGLEREHLNGRVVS